MTFSRPWLLVVIPPVLALVGLVARYGQRTVPRRQHRWAVLARALAVVLLGLAASQPALSLAVDRETVLFLVDRSASTDAGNRARQEAFIAEALAGAPPTGVSGVLVFGGDARVDAALSQGRTPGPIRAVVDESATDLAGALRTAESLLPSEGSRRVVVLSDLVETRGDARTAAGRLGEAGVAVDVVPLDTSRPPDVLVDGVRVPASVRAGDMVPVTAQVRTNQAGPVEVVFSNGAGTVVTQVVQLAVGSNQIEAAVPAGREGFTAVAVEVVAGFDTRAENNRAEGVTRVLGPARMALVEGRAGDGEALRTALEAGGLAVDLLAAVPDEAGLLEYDAVALVNVPADRSAPALASYVEDLGRGLLVVGGDRAYGLGGYQDTALEELLPVQSNPDDLVRRQPVTEVLVIDTSGSMAACHCRRGQFAEGGVNKTDISRAGASLAIAALSPEDQVGVVAVSSGVDWVLPVGVRPGAAEAEAALATLTPEGDTELARGLEAALAELEQVEAGLRHIVLFTDGWDPNEGGLLPLARRIADAGITLSVLGTGEGAGTTLSRMAEVGGGRYYPGTDLSAVPEVFVQETLTVARGLAAEGVFPPALAAPSQVTAELVAAPALLGYVLTKPKATASVPLEIGPDDPLLASWRRGLGRVTAWTSDATTRWSANWVDWEGFVPFWGRVVRDLLPAGLDTPPEVALEAGEVTIAFDPGPVSLAASAVARVRHPDGSVAVVPLARVGEGSFGGSAPQSGPGAYWVSVSVEADDGTSIVSSSGAVSGYQPEFAFRAPDPSLAGALAQATGGRVDPEPALAFDPAPARGRALLPLWPWLVGAALVAFAVDLTLRRLVLVSGDAELWREGFRRRAVRRRRELAERREQLGRLPESEQPSLSGSETLDRLLRRRRR